MKLRTIVSFALLPFVIAIALFAPKIVTALCLGIMSAIASYELLYTTKLVRHPRMLVYTMAVAFLIAIWSFLGSAPVFAAVIAFVFLQGLKYNRPFPMEPRRKCERKFVI